MRHSLKLVVTHDHMKVVITSVKATLEVILRQVGTGKKVEGWEEHVCYVLQENLSYTTFKVSSPLSRYMNASSVVFLLTKPPMNGMSPCATRPSTFPLRTEA